MIKRPGKTIVIALVCFVAGMATTSLTKAQAPRFAALSMAQLDEQQKPIADKILKFSKIGLDGPYPIILRSPQAAKPFIDLLEYLRFGSSVPNRLREFAIMIQGRLWRSQIEWASHYGPAIKAGVKPETLAELKRNERPSDMEPDEAAVYDFSMALYTKHAVSDEVYGRLHQFLNDQQIVDLTLLSGTYVTVASVLSMAQPAMPAGYDIAFKPGEP